MKENNNWYELVDSGEKIAFVSLKDIKYIEMTEENVLVIAYKTSTDIVCNDFEYTSEESLLKDYNVISQMLLSINE